MNLTHEQRERRRDTNRKWMREFRKRNAQSAEEKWLTRGHCPRCTMLLLPEFEVFHRGCPYYEAYLRPSATLAPMMTIIHTVIEISTSTTNTYPNG